jgi:energy-converting hydrogenase Eha subunit A
VNTPSAFSTSHAMPGTLGDMLALMCILLLLKALENRAALVALGFSTAALVMTHHLSTFFVLMPVLLALLVRELIRVRWDVVRTKVEGGYAVFLLSLTLLFWYAYAVPFRERVIPEAFNTSPWVMLVLAYLALLLIPMLVLLRRKLSPAGKYRPAFPSFRRVAIMYALFIAVGVTILAGTAFVTMPGTNINVDDRAAYWFTPQLLLIGISMAGTGWAEYSKDGMFIWAWLGALTAIFILGAATDNHVLIPYRMTQYVIEPLAVFAGAGAIFLHDQWNGTGDRRKAVAMGSALAITFLLSAATAYPPTEIVGGFEEGTNADEMDSVHWLRTGEGNAELLASDHRMSSTVWGFAGINTSWDDAKLTLHGNLEEARGEMRGLQTPTGLHRVELVLLDPTIESGVALEQWETAKPILGAAKEKFSDPLFIKEYESNGVVIYRVDGALL